MKATKGMLFEHGYALLVGVGGPDLPMTEADASALYNLLVDRELAAYPPEQVRLLTGPSASREEILRSLDDLASAAAQDPEATAIIYFSGHGAQVRERGQGTGTHYLIPYDYDPSISEETAIAGAHFTDKIQAINARKLVVLLDCCHAAAIPTTKDFNQVAIKSPRPEELVQTLSHGRGLVLISSCEENQVSYASGSNSIFTTCLLESLQGFGITPGKYVYILDVISYLMQEVPLRVPGRRDKQGIWIAQQTPLISQIAGSNNFPICYCPGSSELRESDENHRIQEIHAHLRSGTQSRVKFYLHIDHRNSAEAQVARKVFDLFNSSRLQTFQPLARLEIIPQGDTKTLSRCLETPLSFLISLLHTRLHRAELDLLIGYLKRAGQRNGRSRLLLFFKRTPTSDPHQIDSTELAGIKELRELADALGLVYHDYFSDDSFQQILWRALIRSLDTWGTTQQAISDQAPTGSEITPSRQAPSFYHPVPPPKHYISRPEIEKPLLAEINSSEAATSPVVVLRGLGGTGKTTLCYNIVSRAFAESDKFLGLFWYSFNEATLDAVSTCFEALVEYIGVPGLLSEWADRPYSANRRLLTVLSQAPFLLVLDGLESVQETDPANPKFGEFTSGLLRSFVIAALQFKGTKLVLISRLAPIDVAYANGCFSLGIGQFTEEEAILYLLASGIQGTRTELTTVAREFGYHPLSLSILNSYIERMCDGSATRFLASFMLGRNTPLSEKLRSILEEYWAKLPREQKTLLTMLAGLDRQPTGGDLAALSMVVNVSTDNRMELHDLNDALEDLVRMGFLAISSYPDGTVGYSIHLMVKQLICNSLAAEGEARRAASFWATTADRDARRQEPDSSEELEALAREVHFLLDAGRDSEAVEIFLGKRLNARLFGSGRHDLGIFLGEKIFDLARTGNTVSRPHRDFFSGYLPDHYACTGRIRSAVRLMKEIPSDDRWTALVDQIWILLRAGEYTAAVQAFEDAPIWRRGEDGWAEAQLASYRGDPICLDLFLHCLTSNAANFLPAYKVRLQTQYAAALINFGKIEDAQDILNQIVRLEKAGFNPYPSEQVHADLQQARIEEFRKRLDTATELCNIALGVAKALGDNYGTLCALLLAARLGFGLDPLFRPYYIDQITMRIEERESVLAEILQILQDSGEGKSLYGFPVEGITYHLLLAWAAANTGQHVKCAANLAQARELSTSCGYSAAEKAFRNIEGSALGQG